jgi:hypothetical protein
LTIAGITGAPEGLLCSQPVEGLPSGWTRILVRHKNGNYKGKDDPYYFSPLQSYKFNSLVKVKRFLVCLEEAGGDEVAAYVNFRGGSNAGQTEAKIKASIIMEKKRKIFTMDPSVADTHDKPSISDSKARNNVQSRQCAAQLRQKVDAIKANAQVEGLEEETKLCESIEERRAQRNNRQRRIELEKKAEIDQVMSTPQDEQTEEEMKLYETTMTAKC